MTVENQTLLVTHPTEITVRVPVESAAMANVITTMRASDPTALATRFHTDRAGATVFLVTKNPVRLTAALAAADFALKATEVVLVALPNLPGLSAQLGVHLARAGVRVLYSYTLTSASGQVYAVFKTTDNCRAGSLLETSGWVYQAAAQHYCQSTAPVAPAPAGTEPA